MHTHPVVTTNSSTTHKPKMIPKARIIVFLESDELLIGWLGAQVLSGMVTVIDRKYEKSVVVGIGMPVLVWVGAIILGVSIAALVQ